MALTARCLSCLVLLAPLAISAAADPPDSAPLDPALREKCLTVLRDGFLSEEFWPSMHAAEALTLAGQSNDVLSGLTKKTADGDQQRCGLAREAVRAGDRTKLPILLEILEKPGSNGHAHAAESLFKVAACGDGHALRAALSQNRDIRLKLMAAAALARCGHPGALDAVREKLTDPDVEIRKIAVWVLGQLGGKPDIKPIRENLDQETDPLARAYVIHSLALLGDAKARKQLGENLASDNSAVKTYAAEFAGHCHAVEFQVALVELLEDPTLDVRIRAAQSLITMSQPRGGADE